MVILDRYLWAVFIVLATAFVLNVRWKLRLRTTRGAILALVVANLPWLVEGLAIALDPRITTHNIFRSSFGWPGPAMVASIVIVWIGMFYWLFTREGAERLAANPIALLRLPRSAAGIKLLFVIALCGGIFGIAAAVITDN